MALCPDLPGWAGTRKVKPIWILLEQETVSGSGISWATCKFAPQHLTTQVFLQAGCPSCRPTNSVKALKAQIGNRNTSNIIIAVISASICGKICDMHTLLKYAKKRGDKRDMWQLHICIKLTCLTVASFAWYLLTLWSTDGTEQFPAGGSKWLKACVGAHDLQNTSWPELFM